jgi:hypothetical protein
MLLPLPRRLRPFLLDLALTVWTVLELTYGVGLGDVSWSPVHPGVHLEPQARAAALTLLVGRPEVAETELTRWVFPVWRFVSTGEATRRRDALDPAIALRDARCPEPSAARSGRLGKAFEEHARAVWLVRHWTINEMLDAWASCAAEELASDEQLKPPWTMSDMAHLWAHAHGGRSPRSVGAKWNVAVGRVARGMLGPPDSLPALPQGCPAREVPPGPPGDMRTPGTSRSLR